MYDVQIGSLMQFDSEEDSVINDKFKPEEISENDSDYYFGAEEIVRFNEKNVFLGIVGRKWFCNNMGDEFAEALIFGGHMIPSLECMLGSVRVNNPFNANMYLAPGAIVVLQRVEFKNTKYLEVSQYLTKLFFCNDEGNPWSIGEFQGRFYWTGEDYSINSPYMKSNHQDEDSEYYDEDDYNQDFEEYDDGDSYSKYGGGPTGELSDDFIDDVLGGEPDAYWNID
jgi:hypothetical protein